KYYRHYLVIGVLRLLKYMQIGSGRN
ncbi:uncharacterized protein METZ01_LOCUS487070, partial [marine metagenome]